MGNYYVLGLQDKEQWLRELDCIKDLCPDLHFRPEYCGLFRDSGEVRLFVYREEGCTVVYPFLLRKVNQIPGLGDKLERELYDITSPYGYGGPLASPAAGEGAWRNFYQSFRDYCAGNDIISEFIRFHPLLENHRILLNNVEVARASSVICVDLRRTDEEIWSGYERNNRKNINKAYREGLEVILEETPAHFSDFISIYHHTLFRNQAGEFYFFNSDFYDCIHKELKNNFLYAHTLKDGQIISTELLLFNHTYIHSFLGGTLEQFYQYRPNNILKHEVIKWAKKKGISYFLLGGGYREGDGIYCYKHSFARDGVLDFYVGKKVHNREAVSTLENLLATKAPRENDSYFPGYRRY
ncbi:GNAT family N-acetyltransferase [Pelotomaculum terephthalicicum JT]|uniref:GNAT family N-acetyltransferase n=1 Tax=Pelotomaculum TaxID=191373 RepID=UPI0009D1979E|nr:MULTISPECIES: GNAT family N-acetyltransferase [Pelotomaculum]MCG9969032.1 GNAT family N-acetyltransferase [Pelotomaculum terephthalicicum JT]OPX92100.1 MAG: FemAB family protein [Pelotomaculum sp. PtaB.Bin117]OPY62890.1 MAG: FemAB family protein [Pelotomaculum sp. PtaU1.Bin065]